MSTIACKLMEDAVLCAHAHLCMHSALNSHNYASIHALNNISIHASHVRRPGLSAAAGSGKLWGLRISAEQGGCSQPFTAHCAEVCTGGYMY